MRGAGRPRWDTSQLGRGKTESRSILSGRARARPSSVEGLIVVVGLLVVVIVFAALLCAQASYAQSDGEGAWNPTGSMAVPRAGHTATLLGGPACRRSPRPAYCGKVLVVGGTTDDPLGAFPTPPVRSTELYDPKTGTWTPAGPLVTARWAHTATLLANGKVLVTGGRSTRTGEFCFTDEETGERVCFPDERETRVNSAELYDPATNTWRSCSEEGQTPSADCPGAMAVESRVDHTATLLSGPGCGANCGKVLLAGGTVPDSGQEQSDPAAELYDPATGRFAKTGELTQTRYQHSATLLRTGKVLVAGGTSPPGFGGPERSETKVSSELYDPATETWSSCSTVLNPGGSPPRPDCPGSLNFPRYNHSATLLRDGRILAAGGTTNAATLASAERYNPATGAWSVTKSLNDRRAGHGDALLPSGKVLIAGGRGRSFSNALGTSELYDASTRGTRWGFAGFMVEARGSDFVQPRSVPAVLLSADPSGFKADPGVCGRNCGKVLVAGGLDDNLNTRRASAELYTPSSPGPAPPGPKPPAPQAAPASCPPGNSKGVTCQRLPGGGYRITGTSAADTITGSARDDIIECGPGNDVVRAGAGNDFVNCGDGNDRVDGGSGNDRLNGEAGNDRITAQTGNDRAIGGSGDDLVHGNNGNDRVGGQSGRDRLSGHEGNDILNGEAGNDRMAGNSGKDRMSGGRGNDRGSGGSGNDRLRGNSGDDVLNGNSGNDTLLGDEGRDRISGNDGNDRLFGGPGNDRLSGDGGRDRLSGGPGRDANGDLNPRRR